VGDGHNGDYQYVTTVLRKMEWGALVVSWLWFFCLKANKGRPGVLDKVERRDIGINNTDQHTPDRLPMESAARPSWGLYEMMAKLWVRVEWQSTRPFPGEQMDRSAW